MELLMRCLRPIAIAAGLLLLVGGCAPSFSPFKHVQDSDDSFAVFRGDPEGNAAIDSEAKVPDTLIFEHKLNGGISAQVVGNDQFAVVPTFYRRIYFFNPNTGKEITSIVTESAIASAAAVVDELIYYAEQSGGDRLTCRNLVNGKKVWNFAVTDPEAAPVVFDEDVYISSRHGTVFALNRWLGDVRWKREVKGQIHTAVAVNEEHVYVGSDRGELICLDRADGDSVWAINNGHAFTSAPMLFGDLVYCGSSDGKMYALDKNSGEEVWSIATAGQIFATPVAISDRLLIASNDRSVYCVTAVDGNLRWSYETDAIIPSSPIAVDDTFICASAAGTVYLLDYDGHLLRTFSVRGMVTAPLSYVDGKLWVVTHDRRVYCFGPASDIIRD
jgi:outer membrane protein assembly factor BamB